MSYYQIELTIASEDNEQAKQKVLKEFQKDLNLPGFRKGFVPMHLVAEHIKPEYLTMGIYEHAVNGWLQEVIKENPTLRFIGEPYDLKQDKKWEETVISLKLDIFPEVEVKSDDWKSHQMEPISAKATQEEIDEAILRLKKNYADYVDAEVITYDSISKVSLRFLDVAGTEMDKGMLYVGQQEFDEFPFFKETFIGKKKWEIFSISYKEKELPPTLHSKKSDVKTIDLSVTDVKQIVLPEITEEILIKLFGKDATVKTPEQLISYVEQTISQQKFDQQLVASVEEFLKTVREKYMHIDIPQSLLTQEVHVRLQNLEKRFGGADKMQEYFKQMGEDKSKSFFEDIRSAAKESLEKYFILQRIAQVLELDINWEKPVDLEAEKKLYAKLVKETAHKTKPEVKTEELKEKRSSKKAKK